MKKQSELPDKPSWERAASDLFRKPGHFLRGIGNCLLHQLITSREDRCLDRLANSFLLLKKGLPPVNPCELFSATDEWYDNLTKDQNMPEPESFNIGTIKDKIPHTFKQFFDLSVTQQKLVLGYQVDRTVRELFPKGKADLGVTRIPSSSSHYESSRKSGGAFNHIGLFVSGETVFPIIDKEKYHKGKKWRHIVLRDSKPLSTNFKRALERSRLFVDEGKYHECYPWFHGEHLPVWDPSENEKIFPSYSFSFLTDFLLPTLAVSQSLVEATEAGFDEPMIANDFYNLGESELFKGDTLEIELKKGRSTIWNNIVTPVALPEPLKVRLISRGPVWRYWMGSCIQKWMHTTLRNHPTFVAIGRPINSEDVDRLGCCDEGEKWLSGDYKAATDLLDPWLSRVACSTLAEQGELGPFLQSLLTEGLVGADLQCVSYHPVPDKSGWGLRVTDRFNCEYMSDDSDAIGDKLCGGTIKQTWGQLMGSPLSFPVLCIVNAAVNRYFFELQSGETAVNRLYSEGKLASGWGYTSHKEWMLSDVPMMINGDDILSRIQSSYYGLWKQFVKVAGLIPSIGKNYLSDSFVIINSTLFRSSETMLGSPGFQEERYYNMGLLHPQEGENIHAVDEWSLDHNVNDLGQISQKLCQGLPFASQDLLMSMFLNDPVVKKLLSQIPRGMSYFVSKKLGGVGLFKTRDNVLSTAQLGYYSRIAMTRGELAPKVALTGLSSDCMSSLQSKISGHVISEDWNLETRYPGPRTELYWEKYSEIPSNEFAFGNYLKSLVQRYGRENVKIEGEKAKLFRHITCGYASAVKSPERTGLLRPLKNGNWSEQELSMFPWSREQFVLYADTQVNSRCGLQQLDDVLQFPASSTSNDSDLAGWASTRVFL